MAESQGSNLQRQETKIKSIFDRSTNHFRYRWGIWEIEKMLKTDRHLSSSENALCSLGLLYDHLPSRKTPLRQRRKYEDKALTLYRRALKVNPKSARATWGIGRVWWHRKNRKAIAYALRAYQLRKRSGERVGLYAQNVGLVYEFLGDYKNAERWLLRGLKENLHDFGSYLNLVVFYKLVGRLKDAKRYTLVLNKLYKKEPLSFKKTPWGKRITSVIRDAFQFK